MPVRRISVPARGFAPAATLALVALLAALLAAPAVGAAAGRPRAGGAAKFVSSCRFSHSAPDDPIVHPGMPGLSHQHDFFGSTVTDADVTVDEMQGAPSTCLEPADTAAYWVPALFSDGTKVDPRAANVYYLAARKAPGTIETLPEGLKLIAGDPRTVRWTCVARLDGRTPPAATPPSCAPGQLLVLHVAFPDCWNGHDLDAADHRSHLAYSRRGVCPASHPVGVPRILLNVRYPAPRGAVSLASGGPETAHADFLNAWDPARLAHLVDACPDAGAGCRQARFVP